MGLQLDGEETIDWGDGQLGQGIKVGEHSFATLKSPRETHCCLPAVNNNMFKSLDQGPFAILMIFSCTLR